MTKLAYDLARADIGTKEWKNGHNPKVVQYFADVGHSWVKDDETAWCAAFVGAMLKRAGMPQTGKLAARSYLEWGERVDLDEAQPGDIVVFWRGSRDSWQGHVGFYVSRDGDGIQVLGGNQANRVGIETYSGDRLLGVRKAPGTQAPTSVRVAATAPRQSPTQSKTVQGSAGQLVAAVLGGVGSLAALDGQAQMVAMIVFAVVGLLAAWIMRERLRKWSEGDR
jgi:uncharacterized protein (TIGR02594 family)